MNISNFNHYRQSLHKKSLQIKNKIWQKDHNKVILLLVIASILLGIFTYQQFARRYFSVSASTQKSHNLNLQKKLNFLTELDNKRKSLLEVTLSNSLQSSIVRKIQASGVNNLKHEARLLTNCTQQYTIYEKFLKKCNKSIDELNAKIKQSTPKK